jgi:hypothetical protein
MKFRLIFLVILCCSVFQVTHAQEKNEGWLLADSIEQPNCEFLLAILDHLVNKMYETPGATAHMVVRKGPNPIENEFYRQYLNTYLGFRKLDRQRFVITAAKGGEKIRIDLWISSEGKKISPAAAPEDMSLKLERSTKPILFIESSVEAVKVDGLTFIEDYSACSIESLNFGLLLNFLEANPAMYARVRIGGATKSRAVRLLGLMRAELSEMQSPAAKRIKFILTKRNVGISQMPRNLSSVTIELIGTD